MLFVPVPVEDPELGRNKWRLVMNSTGFELDPPFTMFGVSFNHIKIECNFGSFVAYDTSTNGPHGRISALSGFVDLRKGGSVFWRKSSMGADLKKARDEIGSAFPAYKGLDLKWAVIATWYKIPMFLSYVYNGTNTYQAILTTDKNLTFLILNYNEVDFHLTSNGTSSHARFGIFKQYDYLITGSSYPDILTIGNRSNTAIPGKWIFRIDQPTIYEPSSVCGIPTQPENGSCTAEEFIPESLAQCNCKVGDMMDPLEFQLKCHRQADDNTVKWTLNVPVCRSLTPTTAQSPQVPAKPSDYTVKLCPSPPIPQYGTCEKKDYHPGSLAKCNCVENYRNTNPHSKLYCVFAEDGSLVWTGGMPICVNSSA